MPSTEVGPRDRQPSRLPHRLASGHSAPTHHPADDYLSPDERSPQAPSPEPAPATLPELAPDTVSDSERRFRTLIEQAADGILVTDAHGHITLANHRACELTGYSAAEVVDLDLVETYLSEERDLGRRRVQLMPPGTIDRFERDLLRKDGSRLPIEASVAWLPDGERQSTFRDIGVRRLAERRHRQAEEDLRRMTHELEARVHERTHELRQSNAALEAANADLHALLREQERLQAELAYRAMHDPLTGLANRMMFTERLDHAQRTSERGVAVVWIDLDRFKEVNDIFGHDVGDEMLEAAADRLREVVRDTDDIARMGGDEFAVVLPNVVETEAEMVADRVLGALTDKDAFRLQVGASVGVAWQTPGTCDGPGLVRRADEAMYLAKAAGGGRSVMD